MKPFLKWAGNKYPILNRIKKVLPEGNRLVEPFVGAGAVFLNTNYDHYLLSDLNSDLIQMYQIIKNEKKEFVDYCRQLFKPINNSEKVFYQMREQFNTTTDAHLKSALFIYLNKHCFNGLCRYNSKGEFNTPYGFYQKPYFPEKELLHFSEKAECAEFQVADFMATFEQAQSGDVIYCDPPYVALSETANFTSYIAKSFGEDQQLELAKQAESLSEKGITVVISNHNTPQIQEAYKNATLHEFSVQRFISSKASARKKADEILAVFSKSPV